MMQFENLSTSSTQQVPKPSVSYSYQRAVLLAAHQCGLEHSDLARWQQLFGKRQNRVSLAEQDVIWQGITERLQATDKGGDLLQALAKLFEPAELGILGYAMASCADLAAGLSLLQRFYPLIGDGGDWQIAQRQEQVLLRYAPQYEVATELRATAVLICVLAISRRLTGHRLGKVQVQVPASMSMPVAWLQPLAELTGQAILSGDYYGVWLSTSDLALPVVTADDRLLDTLVVELEHQLAVLQSQQHSLDDMDEQVRNRLRRTPGITRKQLAIELNCSERTLVRQLKACGHSFRELKQQALQHHAQRLLEQGLRLDAIAEQLNYADASAFIKAYRAWHGRTPKAFKP